MKTSHTTTCARNVHNLTVQQHDMAKEVNSKVCALSTKNIHGFLSRDRLCALRGDKQKFKVRDKHQFTTSQSRIHDPDSITLSSQRHLLAIYLQTSLFLTTTAVPHSVHILMLFSNLYCDRPLFIFDYYQFIIMSSVVKILLFWLCLSLFYSLLKKNSHVLVILFDFLSLSEIRHSLLDIKICQVFLV